MLLLNFQHPMCSVCLEGLDKLAEQHIDEVRHFMAQFEELIGQIGLPPSACARIEALRAALGMDEKTFRRFSPENEEDSPYVTLWFRGARIRFLVTQTPTGYAVKAGDGSSGIIEYFTRETARIAELRANDVLRVIGRLRRPISTAWVTQYIDAEQEAVWETPEVLVARAEYLARVYASGLLGDDVHTIDRWLNYTADLVCVDASLVKIRVGLAARADLLAKRNWLLQCTINRRHPEKGTGVNGVVTREEVEAYRAAAANYGLLADAEVVSAIARREQQVLDADHIKSR